MILSIQASRLRATSRTIRVVMHEVRQQHLAGGVRLEPGFYPARLGVIVRAELFGVDRLPGAPAGRLTQRTLPGIAGHFVELRVQTPLAQRRPLAGVEPEAVA